MNSFVIISTFMTRAEAEIVQGLLIEHGVDARVNADDLNALGPCMSYGSACVLLVPAEQEEYARDVLEAPADFESLKEVSPEPSLFYQNDSFGG